MVRWRRVVPGVLVVLVVAVAAPGALARNEQILLGATYYVSPTGNDSASGTSPATAWRTLDRVTAASLLPGDRVLLRAGSTFSGGLYLQPGESGTPGAPISISTYGSGRARISAGAGTGIFVYDAEEIAISNLVLAGSGASSNTGDGISFYNDLAGNVKLQHVRIIGVDASGFGGYGVAIGGWNKASGFQDVKVTSSALHDNGRGGLTTYGPDFQPGAPSYANQDVYVGHVRAYNNLGNPSDLANPSGNGIVLGSVSKGQIERSVAYGNGSQARAPEGPVAIWAYDSTGVTIQYNEAYGNRTGGPADGDGFDLDQNTSSSVVQYNYSHDNDGAGYLLYSGQSNSSHTGNTVRYNISQNDGRKNSYGAIFGGGRISNDAIYDNTVYLSPSASGSPPAVLFTSVGSGVSVRNNVFYVTGGLPLVIAPTVVTSSLVFQQNDYYSATGAFSVTWGAARYTSLATWRSATGQERLGNAPTGLTLDPLLVSAGGGGTLGNADLLGNLTAYKLQATTPLLNSGLDLQGIFGISTGGRDFYGLALPNGAGFELGAAEA